eukprot:Gb_34657 [translate_table: standard]
MAKFIAKLKEKHLAVAENEEDQQFLEYRAKLEERLAEKEGVCLSLSPEGTISIEEQQEYTQGEKSRDQFVLAPLFIQPLHQGYTGSIKAVEPWEILICHLTLLEHKLKRTADSAVRRRLDIENAEWDRVVAFITLDFLLYSLFVGNVSLCTAYRKAKRQSAWLSLGMDCSMEESNNSLLVKPKLLEWEDLREIGCEQRRASTVATSRLQGELAKEGGEPFSTAVMCGGGVHEWAMYSSGTLQLKEMIYSLIQSIGSQRHRPWAGSTKTL